MLNEDIVERTQKILENIKKTDKKINSFITINSKALERAEFLEKKKKEGKDLGRLFGLTVGVKDCIAVSGLRMTCASRVLENYVSPYDACVVERILKEDAIIVGKTNMDEFACGSDGTKSFFGPTKNPHNLKYVPGGSSSGSGACLGAEMVDLAIGSDTGGSIRCPASFCGVVGIKPTYGLVSRYGLVDMAMSLESPGPMARNVHDVALLLSVISGLDPRDEATRDVSIPDYPKYLLDYDSFEKIRIGIPKEFFENVDEIVKRKVEKAIDKLISAGAETVDISLPNLRYVIPVYYLIVFSEFSSAMAKFDGFKYGYRDPRAREDLIESVSQSRNLSMGREVKRRVLLGTYITLKEYRGRWYTKALQARSVIRKEFLEALNRAEILVGPTMPVLPWKIGEMVEDPLTMYMADVLTVSANLAGICAGSMPCGYFNDLPVGIQFHARPLEEYKLLNVMSILEREIWT
ncbi:MAG: Asp-tRNA(Asn)/Glu-tRNA(Gln) amidotransferase subunit GatA [Candidatus Hydrothermarchaeota archaeon]